MTEIEKLNIEVQTLHESGAYHKRRGFRLSDSTKLLCSNHLLEESVELQAEACIADNKETTIEEAGDVLATYLHLLYLCDITLEEVAEKCLRKLSVEFTDDVDGISTSTPGFTRKNRT